MYKRQFLLGVLPLLGYRVPFADVATVLTFIFGLIPVVGNLLSNTINVILALSVGPWVAVACLAFLIISHKIEYLLCAKYVGQGIGAKTWELDVYKRQVFSWLFGHRHVEFRSQSA